MEALPILPVKASHQTAEAQSPRGLGDIFATLLLEATTRLDARPAVLAFFETRRSNGEPPHRVSAAETISSLDTRDWRDDTRARGAEYSAPAARGPIERIEPVEADAATIDDDEIAGRAPDEADEPRATAATDETSEPASDETGGTAEAPAPLPLDENDPVPEEIAAPAALPVQAQPVAAAAAQAAAQAFGPGNAALAALARAAATSQDPSHAAPQATAARNTAPGAAGQFGAEVGVARVSITPATLVAPSNAALGGGAAVAALAAEAGQAVAQNATRSAQASASTAASQIFGAATTPVSQNQAKPGTRNGPAIGGQVPAGESSGTAQAANTQNGPGRAVAATAVPAAPNAGLPGQGATNSAAGEPGNPNPQNAQTPFATSNNQNAGNFGTTAGPGTDAPVSEAPVSGAGLQNRLAQNAQSENARPQEAPVSGASDPASTGKGPQTGTVRTPAEAVQTTHPATSESSHNNAAQSARANGSAQSGAAVPGAVQAAGQNAASGSAVAGERAMAAAPVQRADGAGQTHSNTPTAPGSFGLIQAGTRTPITLPAQTRPAQSLPANQVAVHIERAVAAGQNRISITLHPAELGQIDVKLIIGNDGAVKAILSIERPETLDLLQRDSRGLEKALQDAGLKTDSGSLSFNLKGEAEQDTAARREDAEAGSRETGTEDPANPELAPEIIAAANAGGIERILDLRV